MLRLTWIEFFLRTIPEMFILIWGIHVISKKYIDIPKYILSSIVLALMTFFIRWLPIYFGVHMIINIILTISIMVIIHIPLIKAVYNTLLITFLLSLSEFLNMIIVSLLDINILNPVIKCIYFLPSLILLSLFVIIINYLLKMKEGIKNVSN